NKPAFAWVLVRSSQPRTCSMLAYDVESWLPGNQSFVGSLGLDFDVNETIIVTDLGVYDDLSNGLTAPLTAYIWDRDNPASPVAQLSFPAGTPGPLIGAQRFLPLPMSLMLSPGFHGTIAADGFSGTDQNFNQFGGNDPGRLITHDDNGLINFVGSG